MVSRAVPFPSVANCHPFANICAELWEGRFDKQLHVQAMHRFRNSYNGPGPRPGYSNSEAILMETERFHLPGVLFRTAVTIVIPGMLTGAASAATAPPAPFVSTAIPVSLNSRGREEPCTYAAMISFRDSNLPARDTSIRLLSTSSGAWMRMQVYFGLFDEEMPAQVFTDNR